MKHILCALGLIGCLWATPAQAIPACWVVEPQIPNYWDPPTISATDCQGRQGFVMDWSPGNPAVEIGEAMLTIFGMQPEWVSPAAVYNQMLIISVGGINPDIYSAQWLLGSDLHPVSARWQHEHGGFPHWPPFQDPTPLEHSPEPSTLTLLGTTLTGLGLYIRRRLRT